MMNLTRSKVAYNLSISPHRESVSYGETILEYVFSSDLYRRKFLEKQKANREEIKTSLSNRFGFTVDIPLIADLRLYSTIEKRGFLLCKDGVEIECRERITLDGATMTAQSLEN